MNGNSGIYNYLSQVDSFLRSQHEQLNQLKAELTNLQEKVNNLRENHTTNIEKIEYKFDQLKIERLEGTLNIGLAPQGMSDPEAFENFSVNQNPISQLPILQKYPNLYQTIKEDVQRFLAMECQQYMDECAIKYNNPLNGPQRTFITQDIERQLDERLHFYLKQTTPNSIRDNSEEEILQFVLAEMKRDIFKAIDAFIKHLPMGGDFS